MEKLLEILILLGFARALGSGLHYLKQPAAVGEILSGVLLAALIANFAGRVPFIGQLPDSLVLEHIADLGIFFLILLASVELRPAEWREHSMQAFAVALGGVVLPFALGAGLGWWLLPDGPNKFALVFLIGTVLSITSIPATVRVFADLKMLGGRLADTVIAAAIFDDIIGVFLLAVLTAVIQSGAVPGAGEFLLLLLKAAVFFAVTGFIGAKVYPHVQRGLKETEIVALEFSALILVALAYGALAEVLNMHWILGVFMAGQFFEPRRVGKRAYEDIRLMVEGITLGVLGPLFFAYIGLRLDLSAFTQAPLLIALLILCAMTGKLIGSGVPARLTGMNNRDSLAVGLAMNSRGAVELIIISVALEAGIFKEAARDGMTEHLFSALIVMPVAATLIAPLALKRLLKTRGEAKDA